MGGVKVKGRTSQGCGEKVFYQSTNGGGFSEKCTWEVHLLRSETQTLHPLARKLEQAQKPKWPDTS
jgi:hypothetical protein